MSFEKKNYLALNNWSAQRAKPWVCKYSKPALWGSEADGATLSYNHYTADSLKFFMTMSTYFFHPNTLL